MEKQLISQVELAHCYTTKLIKMHNPVKSLFNTSNHTTNTLESSRTFKTQVTFSRCVETVVFLVRLE